MDEYVHDGKVGKEIKSGFGIHTKRNEKLVKESR